MVLEHRRMSSEIIDQGHLSPFNKQSFASSFFSEELRLSSEIQIGYWKSGSMPDHHGLEALMSRNKAASSSAFERLNAEENFNHSKPQESYLLKDQKPNANIEHALMGRKNYYNQSMATHKAPYDDSASRSRLHQQITSLTMEASSASLNGIHHENGPNSLPYIFNEKLRLSSNDVLSRQTVNNTQLSFGDDETFQSMEEIEARTIGSLLPDDDDFLAGAIHGFACGSQPNKNDDAEDDLFYSGGGMELEADDRFSCNKTSVSKNGGAYGGQNGGLVNHFDGNILYHEYPTRTLLVRNINNNVDNIDLRVLFEQYGDIQSLYTAYKHRGFAVVSYCDIRAAENAARALQNKPFGCHRLDIDFLSSKDCSFENNINEGTLVVANLDSSISDDDIHQIFAAYGEIKEICGTSNKHYQKIIKFYDVRAAEAALYALNGSDIAGKRIKIETSWPTGASTMQQLPLELKERESSACRQDGLYYKSPSECYGLTILNANSFKGLHDEAMEGIQRAVKTPTSPFLETNFQGIASGGPHNLFPTVGATNMSNHNNPSGHSDSSYSSGPFNLGLHGRPTFQTQSFPEFHDGEINAISYRAANTLSATSMNTISSAVDGIEIRNNSRVGSCDSGRYSNDHKTTATGSLGNGSYTLHGHQYGWNESSTYHQHSPSVMSWQNFPLLMNTHLQQVNGLPRGLSHISKPVVPLHHNIVGSAPAVNPSLWDRRHTYARDCMEVSSHHQGSLGSVGYSSCSRLNSLDFASHNVFSHAAGHSIDVSMPGGHIRIPSPRQRSQTFRGRSSASTTPTSYDGPSDRIRSRRSNSSNNQGDNKKQFELDIDRIIRGEDSRTTLMLKNIPNKYSSKMLLATIDEQHKGTYNFIYLPIDFKNKCNVGYAFINMIEPQYIIPFYKAFHGKKWEKFNSEKVASLAYARIQGKEALIAHFQNSSLMNEDKRCHPILFHSDGPNAGDQEPFPVGSNIRSRRSRSTAENHRRSPSSSSNDDDAPTPATPKDV